MNCDPRDSLILSLMIASGWLAMCRRLLSLSYMILEDTLKRGCIWDASSRVFLTPKAGVILATFVPSVCRQRDNSIAT